MSNILGLVGFNENLDQDVNPIVNKLFAAYGNDIVDVTAGTGYGLNLNSSNKVEFEVFLNTVFFQNFSQRPKTYDTNLNKWTTKHVGRTPIAKYIKKHKSRIYLGWCGFTGPQAPTNDISTAARTLFPSYVFYSDLRTSNELTWGIEWGNNGKTEAGNTRFNLAAGAITQDFVARNIKVGDRLFFTDIGSGATPSALVDGRYFVTKIPSSYELIVDKPFPVTVSNASYWVSGNFFPVGADDGDFITGFGENSDTLLIFKLFSLLFYTGSQLKQVKGAPGTSSQRSVINDRKGNTYYFHGSDLGITGIYRYNGVSSVKVSRAIDPFIQGMVTSNYDDVVAWEDGDELRFFIGDLTNNNEDISMTNAVASLNTTTGAWDVSQIADVITASTKWVVSNVKNSYCGTSDDEILKMASGNSHNGTAIPAVVETGIKYPSGSHIQNEFLYVHGIGKNCRGLRLSYKLWNKPEDYDDRWWPLGEMREDLTEFEPTVKNRHGAGIQFRIEEDGSLENDWIFEKILFFYRPDRSRLL